VVVSYSRKDRIAHCKCGKHITQNPTTHATFAPAGETFLAILVRVRVLYERLRRSAFVISDVPAERRSLAGGVEKSTSPHCARFMISLHDRRKQVANTAERVEVLTARSGGNVDTAHHPGIEQWVRAHHSPVAFGSIRCVNARRLCDKQRQLEHGAREQTQQVCRSGGATNELLLHKGMAGRMVNTSLHSERQADCTSQWPSQTDTRRRDALRYR